MHTLDCRIKGAWYQHEDKGHCCCTLSLRPSWGKCDIFLSPPALTPSSTADRGRLPMFDVYIGFRHETAAKCLPLPQRRLFRTEQKPNFSCLGSQSLGCQHIQIISSFMLQLRGIEVCSVGGKNLHLSLVLKIGALFFESNSWWSLFLLNQLFGIATNICCWKAGISLIKK